MSEPNPNVNAAAPTPVSPTGEPLIPAKYVPVMLAVYFALAGSGLAVLDAFGVAVKWQTLYGFVVTLLGSMLGVASPGLRKAATKVGPMVLVLALGLGLSGCAFTKNVSRATLDCAAPQIVAQVKADLGPAVLDALSKPTADWSEALDKLVLMAGGAGVCAVRAVVAELDKPPAAAPSGAATAAFFVSSGSPADELRLARARRWLDLNGLSP